jgi:hypothetical protein
MWWVKRMAWVTDDIVLATIPGRLHRQQGHCPTAARCLGQRCHPELAHVPSLALWCLLQIPFCRYTQTKDGSTAGASMVVMASSRTRGHDLVLELHGVGLSSDVGTSEAVLGRGSPLPAILLATTPVQPAAA